LLEARKSPKECISWYNEVLRSITERQKKVQMRIEKIPTWAVYLRTLRNKPSMKAVCEQSEWDAMELARPGYHQLIQGSIATETEAETLARGNPNAGLPSATLKNRL